MKTDTTTCTITPEELRKITDALDEMTTLAKQWERFSGGIVAPEIASAEALVRDLRARAK